MSQDAQTLLHFANGFRTSLEFGHHDYFQFHAAREWAMWIISEQMPAPIYMSVQE